MMDGKVIVITGALGRARPGCRGEALARGARVAGVDYAASQVAATPQRLELGGVDLTDAAQPRRRSTGRHAFRQARCADQHRRRLCLRDRRRGRSENLAAHVRAQRHDRAERLARGDPASCRFQRRADRQYRRDGRAAGRRRHGRLRRLKVRRASPHRGARRRAQGQDHRQRRAALDHRHRSQPRQHAEGGFCQMGDAARTRRGDPVPGQRRRKRRDRRADTGERGV